MTTLLRSQIRTESQRVLTQRPSDLYIRLQPSLRNLGSIRSPSSEATLADRRIFETLQVCVFPVLADHTGFRLKFG